MSILRKLISLISRPKKRSLFEDEPSYITRQFSWSGFERGRMLAIPPDWQLWVEFYDGDSRPKWNWDANQKSTSKGFTGGTEGLGYPSLIEAIDACERWFVKHESQHDTLRPGNWIEG